MFANTLRAAARHVLASTKPRRVTSARIIRPSIVTPLPTSSLFCRTFIQSHINQNEKKVVYFSNLPWAVQLDELKAFAEQFGTLEAITMPNDQEGRFAGFANVIYANPEDASACVNYGKTIGAQIGGRKSLLYLLEDAREEPLPRYGSMRPVKQLSPQSRTLFISNLSFEVDAKDLQETFGAFGQIERLNLPTFDSGRNRGWGHVVFTDMESAKNVIGTHQNDPILIRNRPVIMDFARDGRKPSDKLYFSGFLGGVDQMKNALNQHAPKFVKLLRDPVSGENTGTGFLQYASIDKAKEALNFIKENDIFRADFAKDSGDRLREGRARTDESGGAFKPSYGGDWEGGSRSSEYRSPR